ncbi:uncharacterized protein MYCFIDRAFT_192860 [Pseudocercospora fijiensis CIRAD86]|uniref:Uncharacterized protein n=1 Tax=Pseudocercospora fijiensis (strain CIRAD86) TaxID=383855 RepID=N1QBY8_PSEFD|nr:uncharacterized protein MYCFIDRAFT_192860 [Pseudocercospora fijiensis CIRAD86]EME88773.1 hypothetical protein MYCFIDRAFT_192860 [Pseudocercospora fijiensis CIRAD86]
MPRFLRHMQTSRFTCSPEIFRQFGYLYLVPSTFNMDDRFKALLELLGEENLPPCMPTPPPEESLDEPETLSQTASASNSPNAYPAPQALRAPLRPRWKFLLICCSFSASPPRVDMSFGRNQNSNVASFWRRAIWTTCMKTKWQRTHVTLKIWPHSQTTGWKNQDERSDKDNRYELTDEEIEHVEEICDGEYVERGWLESVD